VLGALRIDKMSTQRLAPAKTKPLPEDLTSPQSKLVYHSLDVAGPGTVGDLARRLCLKKITLLDVLSSLQERGHVECRDGEFRPR
jgi:DNA-binding MarR family transcriptional regulator